MKTNKTKLMICLLLLCCAKFFISGAYIAGVYYLDIICFMLLIWCGLGVMYNKFKIPIGKMKNSAFCYPIIVFWGMIICEMIYSYKRYHQPIRSVLEVSYFYLVLGVYFILVFVIDSRDKLETMKHILLVFCTLCNIFQIVYRIFVSTSWNPYFYLTMLSLPIMFSCIVDQKYKTLAWINLITTVICIFILGTNTAISIAFFVILVGVLAVHYIMKVKEAQSKNLIIFIFIAIIVLCFACALLWEFLDVFINSNVGNQVRVHAMEYYWEQFLESPVMGMGLIDPNESEQLFVLVRGGISPLGGENQYYLEDVGIIGYVAQFGLLGIFVLLWIIKTIYNLIKQSKGMAFVENIGFLCMFLVMFISLMPTNKAPIQILPIFFMFLEKNMQLSID